MSATGFATARRSGDGGESVAPQHTSAQVVYARWMRGCGGVLTVLIAAVPVLNIALILRRTGANVLSNDYILFVGMVDRVLSGTYNWTNYFYDTFVVGTHSLAVPFLVRLAVAKYGQWDVHYEMWVAFGVAIGKLVLCYLVLTTGTKRWYRGLLLISLSALMFSVSQIDTFGDGDAGLQIQFTQFGFFLGLYGLQRWSGSWWGIACACVGGALALLSGGAGLPVFPIFFVVLALQRQRDWRRYGALAVAMLISALPYIWFRLVQPKPQSGVVLFIPYPSNASLHLSLLDIPYFIAAMGWPFAQNFNRATCLVVGFAGLCLALWGLRLLAGARNAPWFPAAIPALALGSYGVADVVLTMALRGFFQPWYATHYMPFWIGILAATYVLAAYARPSYHVTAYAIAVVTTLVLAYATSNVTSTDKALLIRTQSPASASCLRNYRADPPYCQQYLFNWGVSPSDFVSLLARPLARHDLSVFAADQQWTLQGDYALENVAAASNGTGHVYWSGDGGKTALPFSDYRHLDLVLRPPNALTWAVHIPRSATRAQLQTAIRVSGSAAHGAVVGYRLTIGAVSTLSVAGTPAGTPATAPRTIALSLLPFAGRTVVVRFAATGPVRGSAARVAFQFPFLDVHLRGDSAVQSAPVVWAPNPGTGDLDYGPALRFSGGPSVFAGFHTTATGRWRRLRRSKLAYAATASFALNDYRFLVLRARTSPSRYARGVQIVWRATSINGKRLLASATVPLTADGREHEYYYDLRLLELPPSFRVVSTRLVVIGRTTRAHRPELDITDVRLVRRAKGLTT